MSSCKYGLPPLFDKKNKGVVASLRKGDKEEYRMMLPANAAVGAADTTEIAARVLRTADEKKLEVMTEDTATTLLK